MSQLQVASFVVGNSWVGLSHSKIVTRVSYRIFCWRGGGIWCALAHDFFFFCLVVPTFQSYNNYSFQLVYCALSALSHTILSLHTEVEVSQNSKKSHPVP